MKSKRKNAVKLKKIEEQRVMHKTGNLILIGPKCSKRKRYVKLIRNLE